MLEFEDDVPVKIVSTCPAMRRSRYIQRGTKGCRMEDVQSVNYSRDVAQDCEENVDAEVGSEAFLEKDANGRNEDGGDDFDNVTIMNAIVSFIA